MIKLPKISNTIIRNYRNNISSLIPFPVKKLPSKVIMKSYSTILDKYDFFESIITENIFEPSYRYNQIIEEYIFLKKFCSVNMNNTSYNEIMMELNIPVVIGRKNVLSSIKNEINKVLDNGLKITKTLCTKDDLIYEWKRINWNVIFMERDFKKMGFDYEKLSSNCRNELLYNLGINVCPYCNKSYILAFSDEDYYDSLAEVDHFYPKSIFGLFQLSIYNFIPACSSCNSKFKGIKTGLLNPYLSGFGDDASFEFKYNSHEDWLKSIYNPSKSNFTIYINVNNCSNKNLIDNNIVTFRLNRIYKNLLEIDHQYFVDLLIKKNSSTHSNVRRISKLLGMKNMEHKDYLRMLTGFEMTEEDDLKKPLSKMTRDLWKH